MTRTCTLLLLVPTLYSAVPAHAQETAPGAAIDACIAIEIDAARLACYDHAAGRQSRTPQQADAAAASARRYRKAIAACASAS